MSGSPVLGMYQGTVSNNVDPLNEARVTMLVPQLLGNAESAWAIPASPTNTVPPVGQVLWVQFSGGDITKPVYSPLGIKDVQDQVSGLGLVTKEPPKQPTALTLTTTPYTTPEGATQARVQASWTAPTENQDGTPLTDMSHYLLQWSYDGSTWVGGTTTEDTLATFDGLHTGANVTVRVQAIDTSGNTSLWSSATILTASSSTPPPVPSAPGVTGVLAGLRVTWDGNDYTGTAMPDWFDHVQVQRDTTSAFASPVTVGTFTGPDFLYDSVQNYANAYYYRLVAYSKTGFASAASASNSGTALQAVSTDILNGAITAAQIAVGAINSSALAAGAVNAAAIAAGAVQAGALATQAVQTINIAPGAVTNAQIANATIGSAQIANGAIGTAQIANAAVGNAQIANLDAGKITTGTLSASLIAVGSLNADVLTAGTITGSLIQAGTITGSLLQANTVTANQIAAGTITANQMAAGTITASSGIIASIDASKITVNKIEASQIDATSLQVAAANITGQLTASQINATGLTISGSQVSGAVATATSATSASSATTVTGFIGSGVTIPPTQLGTGLIPSTTTISGGSITTGSISASKLVIAATVSNLMTDPSFEGPAGAALVAAAGTPWVLDTTKGGNGSPTSVGINTTAGTQTTWSVALAQNVPALPGDQVFLQTDYAATALAGSSSVSLRIYAQYMNAAGTILGYGTVVITPTLDGTWRTASGTYTAPASTVSVSYFLQVYQATSVTAWFDNVVIRPVLGTTQIQSGSITTTQLSATAINGMTITGATIQTASSGQRVLMSGANNDLEVYNSSGTKVVSLGGTNGALTLGSTTAAHMVLDPTVPITTYYDSNNHLVAQVDPVGGAITILDNGTNLRAVQVGKSSLTFAPITAAGTLPTSAQLSSGGSVTGNTGAVSLYSGYTSGSNGVFMGLSENSGTTFPNTPSISIGDQLVTSPVLVTLSGALQYAEPGFYAPGWQVPSLATNWASQDANAVFGGLQYRIDAQDNLVVIGALHMTSSSGMSSGTYTITSSNLVSPYIPKRNWCVVIQHASSANVFKTAAELRVNSTGTIQIATSSTISQNDNFYCSAIIPLGNLL